MILPAVCVVYSQDPDLVRRVKAFLRSMAEVRHVKAPERLDIVLQQSSPAVLILDLQARESRNLLADVPRTWPEVLVLAFGAPRSEPFREAEQAGIYATEDVELERRSFQSLIGRAFDHLRVQQEVRDMREESETSTGHSRPAGRPDSTGLGATSSTPPFIRFSRLFRRSQNLDAVLENMVEGVADISGVARLGIFCRSGESGPYRLRAGLRFLPETEEIEFSERDPLVRWFELNARLINRAQVAQIPDRGERAVLRRALDTFGAEVIVPLYAGGRVLGWIFLGQRETGMTFDAQHLHTLVLVAENVSTALENAILGEQISLQKTFAETLLKSIPPGVVATDETGIVRWFNPTAEEMFGVKAANVMGEVIEAASPKLASVFRETLDTQAPIEIHRWTDAKTGRQLSVETRRLGAEENPHGAVAVISDLTEEEATREKRDLSDRAAFWSDLAASMSHEIRNPLVAIKTFAQLLPDRFDDADFRREFSEIVVKEIDRLDAIVSQINDFANPPELALKPLDVRIPVRKAIENARPSFRRNGEVKIEASLEGDLPAVMGDEQALTEAFTHLLSNAAEAVAEQEKPRVTLTARAIEENGNGGGVLVTVKDNGLGIDPEMKDKVFSPFCTTKARGIGLGLPIVKRTVFDHHGKVKIDSTLPDASTLVSVTLPASSNGH